MARAGTTSIRWRIPSFAALAQNSNSHAKVKRALGKATEWADAQNTTSLQTHTFMFHVSASKPDICIHMANYTEICRYPKATDRTACAKQTHPWSSQDILFCIVEKISACEFIIVEFNLSNGFRNKWRLKAWKYLIAMMPVTISMMCQVCALCTYIHQ